MPADSMIGICEKNFFCVEDLISQIKEKEDFGRKKENAS
jgi:hypothetical protein